MATRFGRYRKGSAFSYSLGVYATVELLGRRPGSPTVILASQQADRNAGVRQIRAACSRLGIPIVVDSPSVGRLSDRESHLVVAVFQKYRAALDPLEPHVVLVSPSNRGNLGTIMRSMLGFGFTNLALIKPAVDIFHPQTIRASMGAVFGISFQYFSCLAEYQACFPRRLYVLSPRGRVPIESLRPRPPFALVFGNEGAGVGPIAAETDSARIGHDAAIDSLNLSCAAAIAFFEVRRTMSCAAPRPISAPPCALDRYSARS